MELVQAEKVLGSESAKRMPARIPLNTSAPVALKLNFTTSFESKEVKCSDMRKRSLKGEDHPKMITSYLVVFGALSRMVKVRGACDKPFWIYKPLNNCAAPAPAGDDILVVASLA